MTFHIRKATTEDCGLIRRLAQEAFPATYAAILSAEQVSYMMEWMYSIESLRKQMTEDGHVYFVACEETTGEPCGYVSVQPEGEHLFHLQKIYVLPRFQGHRLGKQLFQTATGYIKESHPAPCRMRLNVNRKNPALRFYEHLGMRKADEGDFLIGHGYYMNDYIMEMEL